LRYVIIELESTGFYTPVAYVYETVHFIDIRWDGKFNKFPDSKNKWLSCEIKIYCDAVNYELVYLGLIATTNFGRSASNEKRPPSAYKTVTLLFSRFLIQNNNNNNTNAKFRKTRSYIDLDGSHSNGSNSRFHRDYCLGCSRRRRQHYMHTRARTS